MKHSVYTGCFLSTRCFVRAVLACATEIIVTTDIPCPEDAESVDF